MIYCPKEFKIVALRECPVDTFFCDNPEYCAQYWRDHVPAHPLFNPDVETLIVLLLNVRNRIKGHHLVSTGSHDTILCHPIEIFRAAIVMSAPKIVLMHNHPSGDPTPSDADIKVTRDMIRAAKTLKMELLDHIVMGRPCNASPKGWLSIKELGYIYE